LKLEFSGGGSRQLEGWSPHVGSNSNSVSAFVLVGDGSGNKVDSGSSSIERGELSVADFSRNSSINIVLPSLPLRCEQEIVVPGGNL